ncbi:transcriptional regulator FeaR [Pseudomonas silesiensis]|uniref:transcriptional regulator FeaR n=1 Tax=Pseudomonas silesiensis TaxID=1853130 RepID=UPI0030DC466C
MIVSNELRCDGFDQWLLQVNQICGAFNAEPLSSKFSGRIRECHSGALKISFVDACQARLFRTAREISASDDSKYFVVLQLDGTACMAQDGHRALLSVGDMTLIDSSRPSDFAFSENSRQLSLILPRHLVDQSLRFNQARCGQLISSVSPIAMLSNRLIVEVTRQNDLSLQESEATLEAIISLLRPAISDTVDEDDLQERLFNKSLVFIDELIRSENLSPDLLARKVGVSVRGLYRIFARKGVLMSRYIKNRRLDFCAESLRQTGSNQRLSTLAYLWGFSSHSSFSTAFKSRFGFSPAEYRKQHQ